MAAKKAVAGEGSIYFSNYDQRWRAEFFDRDGRRRKLSGFSRAEVTLALRHALTDRDRNVLAAAPGSIPSLSVWLELWLQSMEIQVRPTTLSSYRYCLGLLPTPIVRCRLDQLRPEMFEALYRQLLVERKLANATVRCLHGVLKQALTKAVRYQHLQTNPLTLMKGPPIKQAQITPLNLAQTQALLAACPHATATARWQIALLLGLRQGEVLGLRWIDVNVDAETLDVRQALQYQSGNGLVIVGVKSRAGLRTLYLPAPLLAALKEHRARQHTCRLRLGAAWHDSGLVFTTAFGHPIHPREDNRRWKEMLTAAGLPPFRLHDARHTAATLMLTGRVASDATAGGIRRIA